MKYNLGGGGGRKGQGALEYLIIVAAVLAIAAIVVAFLTGAFSGAKGSGGVSACRSTASSCYNTWETSGTTCSLETCKAPCSDASTSKDVISGTTVDAATCSADGAGTATGCSACRVGDLSAIVKS